MAGLNTVSTYHLLAIMIKTIFLLYICVVCISSVKNTVNIWTFWHWGLLCLCSLSSLWYISPTKHKYSLTQTEQTFQKRIFFYYTRIVGRHRQWTWITDFIIFLVWPSRSPWLVTRWRYFVKLLSSLSDSDFRFAWLYGWNCQMKMCNLSSSSYCGYYPRPPAQHKFRYDCYLSFPGLYCNAVDRPKVTPYRDRTLPPPHFPWSPRIPTTRSSRKINNLIKLQRKVVAFKNWKY